jgi:hypothetical protein
VIDAAVALLATDGDDIVTLDRRDFEDLVRAAGQGDDARLRFIGYFCARSQSIRALATLSVDTSGGPKGGSRR